MIFISNASFGHFRPTSRGWWADLRLVSAELTVRLSVRPAGLQLRWAPVRRAAWTAARWRGPCPWGPTCPTASAASPTRCASSASPADTCSAAPAATRSSTWPSRTSRGCRSTPAPCASPSGSWGAWAPPPRGSSTGPLASCRNPGAGGGEGLSPGVGLALMLCLWTPVDDWSVFLFFIFIFCEQVKCEQTWRHHLKVLGAGLHFQRPLEPSS